MNQKYINQIQKIIEEEDPMDPNSPDDFCWIWEKNILNNWSKIEKDYDFSKNIFEEFKADDFNKKFLLITHPKYIWLNYQINETLGDNDYDIFSVKIIDLLKTYFTKDTFIIRSMNKLSLNKIVNLKISLCNLTFILKSNLKSNDSYSDWNTYSIPIDSNLTYKDFTKIIYNFLIHNNNNQNNNSYDIKLIYKNDTELSNEISYDDFKNKLNKFDSLSEKINNYSGPDDTLNFYIFLDKNSEDEIYDYLKKMKKKKYNYSYEDTYNHENKGLCGLKNIGNTCYMNSALQCLSHITSLREYILSKEYNNDINTNNVLGYNGAIAIAFENLLEKLWKSNNKSFNPSDFKRDISKTNAMFEGYQQHDSQELLSHVIDCLHEDLNLIKKKPATEPIEKKEKSENDYEIAKASWINHLKRNHSVINKIFYGQFKSEVNCPMCKKLSITFDSFQVIPLSIPQIKSKDINFYINSEKNLVDKVKYTLKGSVYTLYNLKISDIKKDLCKYIEGNPDDYYILNVDSVEIADDTKFTFHNIKDSNLDISIFKYSPEDKLILSQTKKDDIVLVKLTIININYCLIMKKNDTVVEVNRRVINILRGFLIENNIDDFENCLVYRSGQYSKEKVHNLEIKLSELIDNDSNLGSYRHNFNESKKVNMLKFKNSIIINCEFSMSFEYKNDISRKVPSKYPNYNNRLSSLLEKSLDFQNNSIKKAETLYDLFDLFIQNEELDENNLWYCNQCKDHIQAIKKIDFYKLPPVLIVQMKKIKGGYSNSSVDENNIDFPIDNLDMSRYALNKKNFNEFNINKSDFDPTNPCNLDNVDKFVKDHDNLEYELTGVINHYGSMNFGHYVAFCKNNNDWYEFNDSRVSKISKNDIVNSSAYILFYQRKLNN